MFKKIDIKLSGPICSCDEQSIAWGLPSDDKGLVGLSLTCKLCNTKLLIPNSKFLAGFSLDRPYPGIKEEPKKVAINPNSHDGDNVIPFIIPATLKKE